VAEIGWNNNLVIMDTCTNDLGREFYIRATRKLGWTKNVLIHQIDNGKLAPMVREISWTHNLVIMDECKNDLESQNQLSTPE